MSENGSDRIEETEKQVKKKPRVPSLLFAILVSIAVALYRFISWLFHNFGGINISSIIYTLTASTEGKSPELVSGAIRYTVPWIIAAIVLANIVIRVLKHHAASAVDSPEIYEKRVRAMRTVFRAGILASVAVIIGVAVYTAVKLDLKGYIKSETTTSSFIDENYIDPDTVDIIFPEKKRNLIFLYVESMEISYSDPEHGGAKPVNVIPELTDIAFEGEMFSGNENRLNGGYSLYGSTYTMGGIFAQTAGLPLNSSAAEISQSEGFLPGITALGDILEKEGYHNVFCIGTSAAFADRDKYFFDHGDYEILDMDYSIENGEIPAEFESPWWGYDDFMLYENAKKHLTELAAKDEPFNFTMLTVDTHAEDGYLCKLCDDKFGDDKYSNSIACASRQAAEFIRWVQQQDFYADTTLIVTGDHCTMDSNYGDDMLPDYKRRIYDVFLNAAVTPESDVYREFSSMDIFPTTIAALGAHISGDQLGLGMNLFAAVPTLTEIYGMDDMNEKLASKTDFFDKALGDIAERSIGVSYDDETGLIHVKVDKPLEYGGKYDGLFAIVHLDQTDLTSPRYMLTDTGDAYEGDITLNFFEYAPGNYVVTVYLLLQDDLPYWYQSGNVVLDEIKFDYKPPLSLTLSEDKNTLIINYKPPADMEQYEAYWFPTWSDQEGASDLCWYKGTKQEDGSWQCEVDVSNHTGSPTLTVHAYGGNDEGATVIVDHSEITR